jgi:nitrogenase molybdenum-cofactor synthesis protein NifE
MDEHDVIFGAEERLKQAIEDLDAGKKPEIIVVLSCCASGIIGEDVQNACRVARTRARVISIDAGGFTGNFTEGYARTLSTIVSEIAEPVETPIPRTVNIIGLLRAGPDLREIRRLLSLLGLIVGVVIPAGASYAQLRTTGSASLNIVICETSGLQVAQYLQQRFGTPYIRCVFPIGAELSQEFLIHVASALNISSVPSLLVQSPETSAPLHPPHVALFAGPTRAIALARFLSIHGMAPVMIILDFETPLISDVRVAAGDECTLLVSPDWDDIEDSLKSHRIGLIIGGLMERPLAARLGIPLIDVMHGSQRTAGPEGGNAVLSMIRERTSP